MCYLTLEPLWDIDNHRDEEDWQNVAEQVPGVAPVKIITISLVYVQCFNKTFCIPHSLDDANRVKVTMKDLLFNALQKLLLTCTFCLFILALACFCKQVDGRWRDISQLRWRQS